MPDALFLFDGLAAQIERAYKELGYTLGWKLPYSPKSTQTKAQRLFFIDLNPGGDVYEHKSPSFEAGNAYLREDWGSGSGKSPLQIQVQQFYRELAEAMNNGADYQDLMNKSLAANYIPFCSPNWNSIDNKSRALEFFRLFWPTILDYCEPRVIISIAKEPYAHMSEILCDQGFTNIGEICEQVNWGRAAYTFGRLSKGSRSIALLRLPHLSLYKIFSRAQCQQPRQKAIAAIAQALD